MDLHVPFSMFPDTYKRYYAAYLALNCRSARRMWDCCRRPVLPSVLLSISRAFREIRAVLGAPAPECTALLRQRTPPVRVHPDCHLCRRGRECRRDPCRLYRPCRLWPNTMEFYLGMVRYYHTDTRYNII